MISRLRLPEALISEFLCWRVRVAVLGVALGVLTVRAAGVLVADLRVLESVPLGAGSGVFEMLIVVGILGVFLFKRPMALCFPGVIRAGVIRKRLT